MSAAADADTIRRVLGGMRTIAVVGLSPKTHRPSFAVAKYMQANGYRIIPVNPAADEILGEKCHANLQAAAAHGLKIEIVDCFRRPEATPELAQQAAHIGAKVLWLQLGVQNEDAKNIAEQSGITYIADRCLKIEHTRFFGAAAGD